jgi:hypothetical protein
MNTENSHLLTAQMYDQTEALVPLVRGAPIK